MAAKRRTGRGSIAPSVGYTIFFKNQSANLAECKEWLFFQTWGLDLEAIANYVPPPPDVPISYAAEDYDRRWRWTTILLPEMITACGNARRVLSWKEIAELRQKEWTGDLQLVAHAITEE